MASALTTFTFASLEMITKVLGSFLLLHNYSKTSTYHSLDRDITLKLLLSNLLLNFLKYIYNYVFIIQGGLFSVHLHFEINDHI